MGATIPPEPAQEPKSEEGSTKMETESSEHTSQPEVEITKY